MNIVNSEIPNDFEAEQAILGAIIYDNNQYALVRSIVKSPSFFYAPAHQYIFRAMIEIVEKNKSIDELILGDELKSLNQLEEIGGYSYLAALVDCVPSSGNTKYYCDIISEHANLRQLISTASDIAKKAIDPERKAYDLIDEGIDKLTKIRQQLSTSAKAVSVFDCFPDIINNIEMVRDGKAEIGLFTGYSEFDRFLGGGLQKGDLIFIGAEPSVGKTSLGICLSYALVCNSKKGLIISIESSKETIIRDRLMPIRLHVDSMKLRAGKMGQDKWDELYQMANDVIYKDLKICDLSTQTSHDIYSLADMEYKTDGLEFILLDYTQLIAPNSNNTNRNQDLGESARMLKRINKDFNIPIIALSQLNEKEKLRDSGELLQVADVFVLLKRSDENRNIINCEFKKNRNGICGSTPLEFVPEWTKFFPVD